MLNRLFPALILSLLFITGYSQNQVTDSTATCVAYWKKGEVKQITINKTSITKKSVDETPETTKVTCKATMKILEESETGYKIQWQYTADNSAPGLSDLEKFKTLTNNLKIIYTASETGAFDSLVNFEEVKTFVQTALDEIPKKYPDPNFKKFIAQFKQAFKTREAIEGVFMKDISVLHSPYGVEYDRKHPQTMESELPNIFGGEPFPATVTLALLSLDPAKDMAKIGILQFVDKEKAAVILKDLLIKIASTIRSDAKKGIEQAGIESVELRDDYRYDLSLSDGWMKKALFTRTVSILDSKKTEITEILIK